MSTTAENYTTGIRVGQLFDELVPEGYSRTAIHQALAELVGELTPPEEEGGAATSHELTLPQDGKGWLLTESEAERLRAIVRSAEPTCEACGQPREASA